MAALLRRIRTLETPPPWSLIGALGAVIAAFALIVIGSTLAGLLFGQTPFATLAGWSIGALAMALFVNFTRNRTPQERAALGIGALENAPQTLVITLVLSLGIGILLDLLSIAVTGVASPVAELLLFFGGQPGAPVTVPPGAKLAAWLIGALLLIVFQPIGEELVFRGVLYPALRHGLGAWAGFFMTALFYAVFHLLAYTSQPQNTLAFLWYALLLPFLDALYLNAVRANTRSTRAAIVAHIGLGLFALLRAFVLAG
jgi:membrane protease YdiL (CAAX protease family)